MAFVADWDYDDEVCCTPTAPCSEHPNAVVQQHAWRNVCGHTNTLLPLYLNPIQKDDEPSPELANLSDSLQMASIPVRDSPAHLSK